MKKLSLQELINYCKEYGFIFQSSEIYDGVKAVYDYGHYGCLLKQNVKNIWWKSMVQLNNNIVGIDSSIIMHPSIWKVSGHVDNFDDLMIDNKDSKKRYRIDILLEQLAEEGKISQNVLEHANALINSNNLEGLYNLVIDNKVCCPISKTCNWAKVRHFNLMFNFEDIDGDTIYLRPETAQGIYVNFLNIKQSTHQKIPFGIAQIGKAFRNEIIARQFTFRMREFEQMEMQFFIKPNEDKQWFEYWKTKRMKWYTDVLGISQENLRFKPHDKLAHYAKAAVDIEYKFPFGFKEIEGIHARGDFDLSNHERCSGKKMRIDETENHIPHVVETSCGCDRLVLMLLSENIINDNGRLIFNIDRQLAPIKCAILPLMKKPELINSAFNVYDQLKYEILCTYDETGSIGKRYVRNDIIGTPFCVTIDYQTLKDNTVTVRERNSMNQTRVAVDNITSCCGKYTVSKA